MYVFPDGRVFTFAVIPRHKIFRIYDLYGALPADRCSEVATCAHAWTVHLVAAYVYVVPELPSVLS